MQIQQITGKNNKGTRIAITINNRIGNLNTFIYNEEYKIIMHTYFQTSIIDCNIQNMT